MTQPPEYTPFRTETQIVGDDIATAMRNLRRDWPHMLRPGETQAPGWASRSGVTLCRKVMGRKPDEPLERICDVEIVHVQRHPLSDLLTCDPQEAREEMTSEGFPGLDPAEFIRRYFVEAQGMKAESVVTRIEWRYLDDEGAA